MKATIDGIVVEGTPKEILEYQNMIEAQKENRKRKLNDDYLSAMGYGLPFVKFSPVKPVKQKAINLKEVIEKEADETFLNSPFWKEVANGWKEDIIKTHLHGDWGKVKGDSDE